MKNPLAIIGRIFIAALGELGRLSVFAASAIVAAVSPPLYGRQILKQMWLIGYNSLPVIGMTALFTGAALAQQIFVGGSRFNAASVVPGVVVIGIVRELGPVLGGLMVAGRVSSAMAAELGTMRVTEQIDALATLSTDPMKYLIAPRLIASVLTLPLLVIVANILGVLGGYLIGTLRLDLNASTYLQVTADFLEQSDIISSLVKAAVFGFVIALMGSYHGFHSKGGAQGVGKATTNAVVSAFVAIMVTNLIITVIVFGGAQ